MRPFRCAGAVILLLVTISLLPIQGGRLSAESAVSTVTRSSARHYSTPKMSLTKPKPSLTPLELWLRTPAVACILLHESTTINGVTLNPGADGNRFQFQNGQWKTTTGLSGSPGSYPVAVQDAAAFSLWQSRGYQPWQADDYWCKRYE